MKTLTIIFSLLSLVIVCSCAAKTKENSASKSPFKSNALYLVNHGWHTGLVVPNENILEPLNFVKQDLGEGNFYEFGWGDKGFYEAERITPWLALKAIFWSTPSVMHVVRFNSQPEDYFQGSEVIKLDISTEGMAKLSQSIAQSFEYNGAPLPKSTRPGLYGKSLFYPGKGRYYATHTCNTWTAEMLKAAGLDFSTFLTLTARGVMTQAENLCADC